MALAQAKTYTIDDIYALPNGQFVPEETPLPDELEAIKRANKSMAEYGTVSHDSIDWD